MIERLWQGAAIVVVGKTDLDDLEKRLEAAEKQNGWLKRVLAGIGSFYWMKWVEGPWYATGDMDELEFFRSLVGEEKP